MTIETKFNTGDEVWYIHNDATCKGKVTEFNIFVCGGNPVIFYGAGGANRTVKQECELFHTKQELLNSL